MKKDHLNALIEKEPKKKKKKNQREKKGKKKPRKWQTEKVERKESNVPDPHSLSLPLRF